MKFVQWNAFKPPVVYTTDRSKAVVLSSYVVYTTRRFMFVLVLLFVYVFILSF